MARTKKEGKKPRSALKDVVSREYTIHLHPKIHTRSFKSKAPTAVKAVKAFAFKHMGTKDVRIDKELNSEIWKFGIKDAPRRIRVKLSRKRNDDEDAKEKLYTYVTLVPGITNFKGLQTTNVENEE
ncbi:60S ribosomal protein L31 [Atractiella rhizophila]|nr:60S ribosomal protein L31 [Atractiella rhizophila]